MYIMSILQSYRNDKSKDTLFMPALRESLSLFLSLRYPEDPCLRQVLLSAVIC